MAGQGSVRGVDARGGTRGRRWSDAWSNIARKGLIGVLTPQANTTVEPEFAILMPAGYAFLNARMVSDKPTIEGRLDDYFVHARSSIAQFANAPLGALAFACTGASYLQGVAREQRGGRSDRGAARGAVHHRRPRGRRSVAAARRERIGLVSPYPPEL